MGQLRGCKIGLMSYLLTWQSISSQGVWLQAATQLLLQSHVCPQHREHPKTLNHSQNPTASAFSLDCEIDTATGDKKMAAFSGSRFKEFVKKYGKVALGVHFSVSAASITGLYVAIKNNVDVESLFDKLHLPGFTKDKNPPVESRQDRTFLEGEVGIPDAEMSTTVVIEEKKKKKNRTAELAASTGGALALAVLCNKALFPIRVPITIALTPPVARFLARRNIIKNRV